MLEERLLKALREEKHKAEQLLLQDRAGIEDYAGYRLQLGKILGLMMAINICTFTFRKDPDDESDASCR